MHRILSFFSIAIFSIFLGSQITEGFLLVPYWKSLSPIAFYEYYSKFGSTINTFYTILTITAVTIPVSICMYCFANKHRALKYAAISSFFALLIIGLFYGYFKDVNTQFYETAFDTAQLQSVLETWEYMHWLRVLFELLSLIFLILTLHRLPQQEYSI